MSVDTEKENAKFLALGKCPYCSTPLEEKDLSVSYMTTEHARGLIHCKTCVLDWAVQFEPCWAEPCDGGG